MTRRHTRTCGAARGTASFAPWAAPWAAPWLLGLLCWVVTPTAGDAQTPTRDTAPTAPEGDSASMNEAPARTPTRAPARRRPAARGADAGVAQPSPSGDGTANEGTSSDARSGQTEPSGGTSAGTTGERAGASHGTASGSTGGDPGSAPEAGQAREGTARTGDGQADTTRNGTSAAGAGTTGTGGAGSAPTGGTAGANGAETSGAGGAGTGTAGAGTAGTGTSSAGTVGAASAGTTGAGTTGAGASGAGAAGAGANGATTPGAGPGTETDPAGATPSAELTDAGVPAEDPDALLDAGVPDVDAGVAEEATEPLAPDAGPVPAQEDTTAAPEAGGAAPTTTVVQVPMPFVQASESIDPWAGLREVIPGIPTGGIKPLGLLGLLALLALFSAFIERLRGRLLRDGLLPTVLAVTQVLVRLLALLIAIALVIQVVPANIRWVVYFIFIASGAALGWSMRDVMPDLIAGVVIVFERRIRRGIWIRSDSFSGAVERVGLRSSWLRDSKGHRVAVPNRLLMQAPVVSDEEGERVQEVVVRLGGADAADIRRALRDAVLASPWTTPESEPQVLRDPVDPDLWQVRGRLLSASFASSFQGQLLERAEAQLAALQSRSRRTRETSPGFEESPAGAPTTKHAKLDKAEKSEKTERADKPEKPEKPEKPKTP